MKHLEVSNTHFFAQDQKNRFKVYSLKQILSKYCELKSFQPTLYLKLTWLK
jgi:hypothetical protein